MVTSYPGPRRVRPGPFCFLESVPTVYIAGGEYFAGNLVRLVKGSRWNSNRAINGPSSYYECRQMGVPKPGANGNVDEGIRSSYSMTTDAVKWDTPEADGRYAVAVTGVTRIV